MLLLSTIGTGEGKMQLSLKTLENYQNETLL